MKSKICSSSGLLGCDNVQCCSRIPKFRKTLLPPSSGCNTTQLWLESSLPWKPQISQQSLMHAPHYLPCYFHFSREGPPSEINQHIKLPTHRF